MSATRPGKRREYVQHSDYSSTDIDQFGESDSSASSYGTENRAGRGAKHQLHIEWVEYVYPDGRRERSFRLSSKPITSDEAKALYEANRHYLRTATLPPDLEIVSPPGSRVLGEIRGLSWLEMVAAVEASQAAA